MREKHGTKKQGFRGIPPAQNCLFITVISANHPRPARRVYDTRRCFFDARRFFSFPQKISRFGAQDRTISKWERGAGFPDVSLLEPLADALHCSVVSLLEGRLVEEPAEIDVRSALAVLIRESRSALRRDWSRRFGILCCLLIAGFVIFGILDRSGAFLQKVERSYTVGIWQNGEKIGETAVTISGERSIWGRSYVGRFAIDAVEKTCRERMQAMIRWEKKSNCANITFAEPGFFGAQAGIEYFLYCDRKLNWFALSLEDGRIIASDQGWSQLQALRPYEYPVYVN